MRFGKPRTPEERELLRQKRRAASAQRKAAMAADPRVQAMKQALKERRRAAYQQQKDRRKVFALEQKRRKQERQVEARAERDAVLMKILRPGTDDA